MTRLGLLLLGLAVVALRLAAQEPAPRFEVASVRPNTSGDLGQSSRIGKGSVATTNMRMRALIVSAYGVWPDRIVGAPPWFERERFDITARAPSETPDNVLRPMLRTLLAERFRLVVHTEMRELPVYALVVDRGDRRLGPNLRASTQSWLSTVLSAFMAVVATVTHAQVGTPIPSPFPGPEESFEVASVKPNRSGAIQWDFDAPPGRVVGTNVVLRDLIRFAYNIYGGDWDIRIDAPEWIKTARFDIDAKTPGTVPTPRALSMLRQLLADRFAMKVHYENRERPVYELVQARADGRLGPQLTPNNIDCGALVEANRAAIAAGKPPLVTFDPSKRPNCGSRATGPNEISSGAFTMEQLAMQLSRPVGRPVINNTGLTGGFDYDLRWAPEQAVPDGAVRESALPSIFTALEEQLGLKLVPSRGPVEVLVIDSVEMPAPN